MNTNFFTPNLPGVAGCWLTVLCIPGSDPIHLHSYRLQKLYLENVRNVISQPHFGTVKCRIPQRGHSEPWFLYGVWKCLDVCSREGILVLYSFKG